MLRLLNNKDRLLLEGLIDEAGIKGVLGMVEYICFLKSQQASEDNNSHLSLIWKQNEYLLNKVGEIFHM